MSATSPNTSHVGEREVVEACLGILPYLDWTISDECPAHHPTLPSAVASFKDRIEKATGKTIAELRGERLSRLTTPSTTPDYDDEISDEQMEVIRKLANSKTPSDDTETTLRKADDTQDAGLVEELKRLRRLLDEPKPEPEKAGRMDAVDRQNVDHFNHWQWSKRVLQARRDLAERLPRILDALKAQEGQGHG